MRSRFLNIDYFSLAPPESRGTLTFLHLPVPCLTCPPPSTVRDHLCFHSTLPASNYIERLPIDDALSKFLSGVLPHRIDVDFQYFEAAMPSKHNCLSSSSFGIAQARISQEAVAILEENEMENCRILDSGAAIEFSNDRKSTALIEKNEGTCDVTQFETPELDVHLGSTCFPEDVVMQILDEASKNESDLEMLKSGLSIQYPSEVLHSISAVEYFNSEYFGGQNTYSSDDYMSLPKLPKSGQSKFPILEVDEESLGISTLSCAEESVGSYFDDIRPQNMDETHSVIEHKEILGGTNYNMMNFLSDDCLSKQSVVLPDVLHEMDFIIMLEAENFHGNGNPALTGKSLSDMITFQEILFIDENSLQIFESFYNAKSMDDPVTSEFMFKKDFNFKNFDELIITNEIALMDDVFKPLPVPALSDHGKMRSLYVFIEERLSNLKTQPQFASDSIYLNWDLLEEDKRNFNLYHYFQNMWAKRDLNFTDFGGESFNDGKIVFDLVSLSDVQDGCHIKQSEELQKLLSDCAYQSESHSLCVGSSNQLDGGSPKQEIGEQLDERNAERASLWFKSTSEVSHLDYFLNPRKATARKNCNLAVESNDADVNDLKVTCTDFKSTCRNTILQSQRWNVDLHNVLLSDSILALVGNLEKFYWAVLQSETELTQNSSMDHFQLMKLPKHKLMELHENGKNMAFVLLCAIKQAAWYLCFYGLRPASLYIDELCQSLDYLKLRFSFLQSLIKDENKKIGDKVALAHPALAVFDEILQSDIKQDDLKVLIVSEEVFWWSLKCLLISIGLSFNEFHNTHANQPYAYDTVEDTDSKLNVVNSNCLIVSYKHISSFFPFNKFGIILEYGGPSGSSRIADLSPNSTGLPHLHFLKVELDVHSAVEALCEGVELPLPAEMSMENGIHNIINPNKRMMDPRLERLLNFVPLEKNYDIGSSKMADDAECFLRPLSSGQPEHSHQSMESFPETLIIVNTQNVDKEMIVSRRSTYQAILAMEKRGIQVVERDLDLPVDIIISSAICLVWYDNRNLGKKSTPATEASSSLPLCIENIAANILTLLSFSYDGCFLVFEGEINFISAIMESSDGLYAAAASLGIDLQIFFSYSPQFTNEIMISCINYATKLTKGLYPKMPDSLTLAESFLTKFPTINPLVAHAILSTGATLTEILGWSHEHRINVLERYRVPEESVALFSTLCKYGEREDSKSIMTDCSSSVSSGPDSDKCHLFQVDYERKRKKQVESSEEFKPFSDELLQFQQLHQEADGLLDSSNPSKPGVPGKSNYSGRSNDITGQGFNVTTPMKTPVRVSQPSCDPWSYKASLIMEQKKQPSVSFKDEGLAPNDKLGTARMSKNLTWPGLSFSEKLDEDITGEVVDLTEDPLLNKKSSSIANSRNVPSVDFMISPDFLTQAERVQTKNTTVRRLSFGQLSQPEFKDMWNSSNDTRGEVDNNPEPNFVMQISPIDVKYRGKNSNEDLTPVYKRNLQGSSPFQEEMSQLGGRTPLSRALHSTTPLKNSPWTLEFINRIKEKSRLRQKALSCDKSVSCFGYSGSTSEVSNRRRPPPPPPPPEFFAYRGRRIENTPKQKRQKQCAQPLNSYKSGKRSASILPTWTPNDKRATKMLSFAMNESQSQTKLVWNDETQGQAKKSRYETQKSL